MVDNKFLFEDMPVSKALAELAIPTIISQLIVMVYNLADTFFIGQTNDPLKIAAPAIASVLFFMLTAVANLFGIGGGTMVSRFLGMKDRKGAVSISSLSLYLSFAATFLYCAICLVFMKPILSMIGASENTLDYTCEYTFWVIVIGGIPTEISMVMSHLLRSEGYSKQSGFGMSMGGMLNIILDPVFMFVILPKGNEVFGAALATLIANVSTMIYYFCVYAKLRDNSVISVNPKVALSGCKYIVDILKIGFPSAVSSALTSLSIMVTTSLASLYGDIPVASIGIVKKIEMLPLNTVTGLCQGMLPLISYNYAAGNRNRTKKTIFLSFTSGTFITLICIILFNIYSNDISGIFIKETETRIMTASFLRIMSLAIPLTFVNLHIRYTLQALGKGKESLILTLCRQGIIHIPILYVMNKIWGLYGITWGQFAADAITIVLSILFLKLTRTQVRHKIPCV